MEAYKNAYCYVCNTNTIGNTETLCPLPGDDPLDLLDVSVFSTLVDYKRYQQAYDDQTATTTETACKSYEIMDEIMVGNYI